MLGRLFRRKQTAVHGGAADGRITLPSALITIEGHPELEVLFIAPSDEDIQRGLNAWRWLNIASLTPIAVSVFGDVFLEGPQGVVMLDTLEGRLVQVAGDRANLIALLQSEETRDNLLFAGMVVRLRQLGVLLGPGECYDFKVAPVLGGPMTAEDVHAMSFVVKLHIAGQLHEQVKDLPPGTPIGRIEISD